MILQVNEGGMLELFWRQPGVHSWTYRTALDFLARYATPRRGLRGLRESLAQRGGAKAMLRASDADAMHQGASLVASGGLVLAQARFTNALHGAGKTLGSQWNSIFILRREKLHPAPDLEAALNWLAGIKAVMKSLAEQRKDENPNKLTLQLTERQFRAQQRELNQVRSLASSGPGVPDFSKLDDAGFIEQLERVLQLGLLIPIYHRPAGEIESIPGAPPPGPGTQLKSGSDREEAPDPDTFGSGHEGSSQSRALSDAAEDGYPFCEMCAKEAAGRAGKP